MAKTAVLSINVVKRDNSIVPFDPSKITRAIALAAADANISVTSDAVVAATGACIDAVREVGEVRGSIGVEEIQDLIVSTLIAKVPPVALAYTTHRVQRNHTRSERLTPDPNAIRDYMHVAKYAQWREDLGNRRETREESICRREKMDLEKYPHAADVFKWAYDTGVRQELVLPSMRSMQFAGSAITAINNRMFNCCGTLIDRPEVFSEVLFQLLCGCGVGYSVQWHHVEKLPELKFINKNDVKHVVVADSITGWAEAVGELVNAYMYTGRYVEFAFHRIRDRGKRLKTSGGRAPGHLPLATALTDIRRILHGAMGRKLRPFEAHLILCTLAQAVLSGGIRRSALIAIFSLDDGEMMRCKTGDWWTTHPCLAMANNSVALLRGEVTKAQFERIFHATRQYGEPAIYWVSHPDYVPNPCVEIGFNPILKVTPEVRMIMKQMVTEGYSIPKSAFTLGSLHSGIGHCNLSSIVVSPDMDEDTLHRAARACTIIGTGQAGYHDLKYVSWVSTALLRRDALIGVSMTGMASNPKLAFDPDVLLRTADVVNTTNVEIANLIGIRPAARTTCVKPEGSGTLWLGRTEHGMHATWSRRSIRRIVANENEPPFVFFRDTNPHMCRQKENGDWVIEFPAAAPDSALLRDEFCGITFLKVTKLIQQNWVKPGTMREVDSPGLTHNVSCTCNVPAEQWDEVTDYVWDNREFFAGVSFFPFDGDKRYPFAPNEAVTTVSDEARFNELIRRYKPVDYTKLIENDDNTQHTQEVACAGGACALE